MSDIKQISIGNTTYDLKDEKARIQVGTMPTATADNYGTVVQYVGATTNDYTHGYFYECTRAMGTQLYYWMNVPVSEGGGTGGGHTIINDAGISMTQRAGLQFEGMGVTDDSTNDKTIVTLPSPDYVDEQYNNSTTYSKGMTCIEGNVRYRYKNSTATSGHRPPDTTYWEVYSITTELNSGAKLIKSATSSTFASGFSDFYNVLSGMTYEEVAETHIDFAGGTVLLYPKSVSGGYQYIGMRKFQDTILVEVVVINSATSANFYRYTLATTGITMQDLSDTSYPGQTIELYK